MANIKATLANIGFDINDYLSNSLGSQYKVYTPSDINETLGDDDDAWDEGDYLILCLDLEIDPESLSNDIPLHPGFIIKHEELIKFEAHSIIPPGPKFLNTDWMVLIINILCYMNNLTIESDH